MSEEPNDTEATDDKPIEAHSADGGGGGPTGATRATITIERRGALAIAGAASALLILLATALVIEADGDLPGDRPPPRGEQGLPFGERPGPGFGGPAPPFEGQGAPDLEAPSPPDDGSSEGEGADES